jgi:hypothetical protein
MTSSRGTWRTLLAAVSLLAIGAAGGVAVDRLIQSHTDSRTIHFSQVHSDPVGALDKLVQLRPEQRTRVAAILEKRQADIDAVWHDTHARLKATVDSVVSEIAAALDPDQAEKFRKLADELHSTGRVRVPMH